MRIPFFFLFTFSTACFAQEVSWISYGTSNYSHWKRNSEQSRVNSAGEIVSFGSFDDTLNVQYQQIISNGNQDFYIAKYDTYGNLIWIASYGGESTEVINSIAFDENDNILLAVTARSSFNFDTTHIDITKGQSLLFKLDTNGRLIWYKQGGVGATTGFGKVKVDSEKNIIITGSYAFGNAEFFGEVFPNTAPNVGVYVIKLDSVGDFLWGKWGAEVGCCTSLLSSFSDVEIDGNDDLIIIGYYYNRFLFEGIRINVGDDGNKFIIKLSKNGDLIWLKTSGGNGMIGSILIHSITNLLIDKEENSLYVSGKFNDELLFFGKKLYEQYTYENSFLAKLDSLGNLQWLRHLSGGFVTVNDMQFSNDGHVFITGKYRDTLDVEDFKIIQPLQQTFILKYNKEGNPVNGFSTTGYSSTGLSIDLDNGDNIICAGSFAREMLFGCDSIYSSILVPYVVKIGNENEIIDLNIKSDDPVCLAEDSTFTLSIKRFQRFENYSWNFPKYLDSISYSYNYPFYDLVLKYNELKDSLMINVVAKEKCGVIFQSPNYIKKILPKPEKPSFLDTIETLCVPDSLQISIVPQANSEEFIWSSPLGINVASETTSDTFNIFYFEAGFVSGELYVQAINECGTSKVDTSNVIYGEKSPTVNGPIIGDEELCINTEYTFEIDEFERGLRYTWKFKSDERYIESNSPILNITFYQPEIVDTIFLFAENECGRSNILKKTISVHGLPENISIEKDSCGNYLKIAADNSISWYRNNKKIDFVDSIIHIHETGVYHAKIITQCGIIQTEEMEVFPANQKNVFIPNLVTPNDDGLNDTFILNEPLSGSEVNIYNRYGKLIYENKNYDNSFSGYNVLSGTYYYVVRNKCFDTNFKGWVSVLK